jgi:hypothetical protein
MECTYYGRLDNTKPYFTIGYQLMDELIKKAFDKEVEKFRKEVSNNFNKYKKEHEKDLKMVRAFVNALLKSFEGPKRKPVELNKKEETKKMFEWSDADEEYGTEDEEDY